MTYQIETDVTILPELRATRKSKYPFATMQKGYSFAFPKSERVNVYSASNGAAKKYNHKYVIGNDPKCEDNYRIWRIG